MQSRILCDEFRQEINQPNDNYPINTTILVTFLFYGTIVQKNLYAILQFSTYQMYKICSSQ